ETGDFFKYRLTQNSWTVTDKNGTVYTFGLHDSAQQNNPDNPSQIYKWMLEKVQDSNGNFITYTYYKDAGQIYPDTITYTGNGSDVGIFSVVFTRASRTDTIADSTPGFITLTNYRISQIQTFMSTTWIRTYALAYTTDS